MADGGSVDVPASLDLLDVVGNGHDCERFLWIRALSDPSLPRKARVDLVDEAQQAPGELLFVVSRDGTTAATTLTVRDGTGAGSCYLSAFCRSDPGEPVLGDLVELAGARAVAAGVADVRCGAAEDRPHLAALRERHGFAEHERYRRFHADVHGDDEGAVELPAGVRVATLAERGELVAEAHRVHREGMLDAPGDFPRPEEPLGEWLRRIDSSPVLGRDLVVALHDDEAAVLAVVELKRLAAGSDRAWVDLLSVDRAHRGRGIGSAAKRAATAVAARAGLRRLQSMNHAANERICRLNERLGWTEDPVYVQLSRTVS